MVSASGATPLSSSRTRGAAERRSRYRITAALALVTVVAVASSAWAQLSTREPTFVLKVDRVQVPSDDAFVCEVTLSFGGESADSYRAPEWKGFRVLSEQPSQSTQIQMGGGGVFRQTIYSWTYHLQPMREGTFSLGPARVRADGREIKTNTVSVTIGPALGQRRPPPAARTPFGRRGLPGFEDLFGAPAEPEPPAAQTDGAASFVRAVADKQKVFVGEPVTVEWLLHLTERQDKYQTVKEPATDGFWSEDLPLPGQQGSLQLSQQNIGGRPYLVAPLLRKALFPMQVGKLTISPMESEISQVDFFGRSLRQQRLQAEPLTIEVRPLPTQGRPAPFDPAWAAQGTNVGKFQIAARVDRERVSVGEAVTLTVVVSGQGNLRKLQAPSLPALEGWKSYEPKVDVKTDRANGISGEKIIEHLLLPERTGTAMVPALALAYFDPAAGAYAVAQTAPLRLEVVGDAKAPSLPPTGAQAGTLAGAPQGAENVLPVEIRPPRNRSELARDLGTTFYRSRWFLGLLVLPPLGLLFTVLFDDLRQRLGRDTERARRRKRQRLVRARLGAAERHLEAGATAPFFIEIDRVLRELLSGKIGRSAAGLSHEELGQALARSSAAPEVSGRLLALLEACDRGRFAPGSVGTEELRAAFATAGELLIELERARFGEAA